MGATDELRRLLDERGVEYNTHGERYGTWYDTPLGGRVYVAENNAGYLHVKSDAMTPEQAIAATVGRSCASCPEMDNPDSYIMHLHSALEVADRGAGTCEGSFHESGDLSSGRVPLYYCKGTNKSVFVEHDARFCPMCGRRL